MNILPRLKEITNFAFLKARPTEEGGAPRVQLFNYRRIWLTTVILTNLVALLPLIAITTADYKTTEKAIVTEHMLRTARVVSNAYRSLAFLLEERQSALRFLAASSPVDELIKPSRLAALLEALRKGFGGGFEDIGVIDASGLQYSYEGPFVLRGKDYSRQPWFEKVVKEGAYVSGVFLGFRQQPHFAIAVKKDSADGSFQIIRTTMSIEPLDKLLAGLHLGGRGDAFIIDRAGVLQNNSSYYGRVLSSSPLPVPKYSSSTMVVERRMASGEAVIVGYRFVDNSPFILMIIKTKRELMQSWLRTKRNLIVFLLINVCLILIVTAGTATVLIRKLFAADQQRMQSAHQVEYTAKMASIGRLAANVSHEINNPLAIIYEKAGLIKDLFALTHEYKQDPKLIRLVDSILESVDRAAEITKRLLAFYRNLEAGNEMIDLKDLIIGVIGFVRKDAELKSIAIHLDIPDEMPLIENHRGKLQQIFVNIINNSFDAMDKEGRLSIGVSKTADGDLCVRVCDDGCGILNKDIPYIFEPFFSTKTGRGGTGLGLAVTYNLVHEIGGRISVDSREGADTCFSITLPLKPKDKEEKSHARAFSG